MEEPYLITYTGKKFHFLKPDPEEITIFDIAHHLSQLCRWTGASRHFFSVAQHSLAVERVVERRKVSRTVRLQALLHDASEAYMADLNRPVKRACKDYMAIEKGVREAIMLRYSLPTELDDRVTQADESMQHTEAQALLPVAPGWLIRSLLDPHTDIKELSMGVVEKLFLDKFLELQ